MTTDVDALITRLREDVGFDGQKLLAADALSSQAERIKQQALEAKCALLAASLAQEEKRSAELERDARRYEFLRQRAELRQYDMGYYWNIKTVDAPMGMPLMDATLANVIDAAIAIQAGSKEGT